MYLIAKLDLSYAGVERFFALAPQVRAAMEANGCRMMHAFVQETGRLNTVIHVWELPDANTYFAAVAALRADPRFPDIVAVLDSAIVEETLTFASDAPYAP